MNRNSGAKPFWYIAGPLLLYFIIQFAAEIVAGLAVMLPHMNEVIDYEKLSSALSVDQINEIALESAQRLYEIVGRYSVQMVAFAAVCTLLLTVPLFIRDRRRATQQVFPGKALPGAGKFVFAAVLGATFCLAVNSLLAMGSMAVAGGALLSQRGTEDPALWIQIVCLGIIVPLSEDMMFLGLLFRRFRERSTFVHAAVWSALVYGLTHANPVQVLYAGVLAMLLCYVYEVSGTIKPALLMHIAVNITAVVISGAWMEQHLFTDPLKTGCAAVVGAFLASSMFVLLRNGKQVRDLGETGNNDPDLYGRK